jgi:hypothetical protein
MDPRADKSRRRVHAALPILSAATALLTLQDAGEPTEGAAKAFARVAFDAADGAVEQEAGMIHARSNFDAASSPTDMTPTGAQSPRADEPGDDPSEIDASSLYSARKRAVSAPAKQTKGSSSSSTAREHPYVKRLAALRAVVALSPRPWDLVASLFESSTCTDLSDVKACGQMEIALLTAVAGAVQPRMRPSTHSLCIILAACGVSVPGTPKALASVEDGTCLSACLPKPTTLLVRYVALWTFNERWPTTQQSRFSSLASIPQPSPETLLAAHDDDEDQPPRARSHSAGEGWFRHLDMSNSRLSDTASQRAESLAADSAFRVDMSEFPSPPSFDEDRRATPTPPPPLDQLAHDLQPSPSAVSVAFPPVFHLSRAVILARQVSASTTAGSQPFPSLHAEPPRRLGSAVAASPLPVDRVIAIDSRWTQATLEATEDELQSRVASTGGRLPWSLNWRLSAIGLAPALAAVLSLCRREDAARVKRKLEVSQERASQSLVKGLRCVWASMLSCPAVALLWKRVGGDSNSVWHPDDVREFLPDTPFDEDDIAVSPPLTASRSAEQAPRSPLFLSRAVSDGETPKSVWLQRKRAAGQVVLDREGKPVVPLSSTVWGDYASLARFTLHRGDSEPSLSDPLRMERMSSVEIQAIQDLIIVAERLRCLSVPLQDCGDHFAPATALQRQPTASDVAASLTIAPPPPQTDIDPALVITSFEELPPVWRVDDLPGINVLRLASPASSGPAIPPARHASLSNHSSRGDKGASSLEVFGPLDDARVNDVAGIDDFLGGYSLGLGGEHFAGGVSSGYSMADGETSPEGLPSRSRSLLATVADDEQLNMVIRIVDAAVAEEAPVSPAPAPTAALDGGAKATSNKREPILTVEEVGRDDPAFLQARREFMFEATRAIVAAGGSMLMSQVGEMLRRGMSQEVNDIIEGGKRRAKVWKAHLKWLLGSGHFSYENHHVFLRSDAERSAALQQRARDILIDAGAPLPLSSVVNLLLSELPENIADRKTLEGILVGPSGSARLVLDSNGFLRLKAGARGGGDASPVAEAEAASAPARPAWEQIRLSPQEADLRYRQAVRECLLSRKDGAARLQTIHSEYPTKFPPSLLSSLSSTPENVLCAPPLEFHVHYTVSPDGAGALERVYIVSLAAHAHGGSAHPDDSTEANGAHSIQQLALALCAAGGIVPAFASEEHALSVACMVRALPQVERIRGTPPPFRVDEIVETLSRAYRPPQFAQSKILSWRGPTEPADETPSDSSRFAQDMSGQPSSAQLWRSVVQAAASAGNGILCYTPPTSGHRASSQNHDRGFLSLEPSASRLLVLRALGTALLLEALSEASPPPSDALAPASSSTPYDSVQVPSRVTVAGTIKRTAEFIGADLIETALSTRNGPDIAKLLVEDSDGQLFLQIAPGSGELALQLSPDAHRRVIEAVETADVLFTAQSRPRVRSISGRKVADTVRAHMRGAEARGLSSLPLVDIARILAIELPAGTLERVSVFVAAAAEARNLHGISAVTDAAATVSALPGASASDASKERVAAAAAAAASMVASLQQHAWVEAVDSEDDSHPSEEGELSRRPGFVFKHQQRAPLAVIIEECCPELQVRGGSVCRRSMPDATGRDGASDVGTPPGMYPQSSAGALTGPIPMRRSESFTSPIRVPDVLLRAAGVSLEQFSSHMSHADRAAEAGPTELDPPPQFVLTSRQASIGSLGAKVSSQGPLHWGVPLDLPERHDRELKAFKLTGWTDWMRVQLPKYASAFLNTNGGSLYFGVSDDQQVFTAPLSPRLQDQIVCEVDRILQVMVKPAVAGNAYCVEFLPVAVPATEAEIAAAMACLSVSRSEASDPRIMAECHVIMVRFFAQDPLESRAYLARRATLPTLHKSPPEPSAWTMFVRQQASIRELSTSESIVEWHHRKHQEERAITVRFLLEALRSHAPQQESQHSSALAASVQSVASTAREALEIAASAQEEMEARVARMTDQITKSILSTIPSIVETATAQAVALVTNPHHEGVVYPGGYHHVHHHARTPPPPPQYGGGAHRPSTATPHHRATAPSSRQHPPRSEYPRGWS